MIEKRGKRARSKNAIMHAARELFEEKGVCHVTFNDIADRADMCRTTIFNYFSTINDLMLAIADEEVRDVVEFCEDSRHEGKELIEDIFEMLIRDAAKYPVLTAKLITNSMICDRERKSLADIERVISDQLPDHLSEREKEELVIMLTGAYYGLINHNLINGKDFNVRRLTRQMNEFINRIY